MFGRKRGLIFKLVEGKKINLPLLPGFSAIPLLVFGNLLF